MCRLALPIMAICWLALASSASAQVRSLAPAAAPPADTNPFRKSYLSLELARNYPLSFSQNHYEPGKYFPALWYLHDLDQDWVMGIGVQFKILKRLEDDDSAESQSRFLALWTVTHETLYVVRLNHPTYLLIGPKILYLLPTKAAHLPLQREPDLHSEIGAALSLGLTRVVTDHLLLNVRADRWRGTRSMRLHGLEVAFGFSYALD